MATVTGAVVLLNPETRERVVLHTGDTVPAWALPLITNPEALQAEDGDEDLLGDVEYEDEVERPSGSASLVAWTEYALDQGATPEQLKGLGRDAVRDLF